MTLKIIRADIASVKADAIVNTANPMPVVGGGSDKAIYQAAGKNDLLKARKKIGKLEVSHVAVTEAYNLNCKYLLHTVGPVWTGGDNSEITKLEDCYNNCLAKAYELECETIAFPLISSGIYRFPRDLALKIAIKCFSDFLLKHEINIILVVFDSDSYKLSSQLFSDIDTYVSEHYVQQKIMDEYPSCSVRFGFKNIQKDISASKNLDKVLENIGPNFKETLFSLIDEKGLKDPEVYKRANVDRKTFSKIRCQENYLPRKKIVLALGVALNLSYSEMSDFLSTAGMAFSPASKSDLLVKYFIENNIYDINTINLALFEYGFECLGS